MFRFVIGLLIIIRETLIILFVIAVHIVFYEFPRFIKKVM